MSKRKHDDSNGQDGLDDLVLEFSSGDSMPVCSVPLRMCSPVFNSMLSSGMREAQQRTIRVEVATKEEFDSFYSLLKPGAFSPERITHDNVDAMLTISLYYQVGFLRDACEARLLRLPATVDRFLQAEKMGLKRQQSRCAHELAQLCTEEDLKRLQEASSDALMAVATAMRRLLQEDDIDRILRSATLDLRVRRGPDWKWQNQDGGGFGMTAISEPERPRPPGWVVVNWDDGSTGHYRVGAEGKYDLMVLGRVDALVVEGAGGVGSQCNGLYNLNRSFAGKPMFKKDGGSAIIYFSGCWKINYQDATDGWYYCYPNCEATTPPIGLWSTEGYGAGADPPPTLRLLQEEESSPPG